MILFEFIKSGLNKGEHCIYVSEKDKEAVIREMSDADINVYHGSGSHISRFPRGRNPCSDQPLSQIKLQEEKWNCFSPLSNSFSMFAPKYAR